MGAPITAWLLIAQLTTSSYSAIAIPGIVSEAECQRIAQVRALKNVSCTAYTLADGRGNVTVNYLLAQ